MKQIQSLVHLEEVINLNSGSDYATDSVTASVKAPAVLDTQKTPLSEPPEAQGRVASSKDFPWLTFPRLALLFIAVRLPWIFVIPMGEAPDEFAHYWVIKFMKEHCRLPLAAEVHAGGPSAVYGSLPQFGYLPHLLACGWGSVDLIPLASRFGSLAMGLVLLYATWRSSRIIFAKKPLLATALPLAVLLHPQMIFLHGYANCDATSTALCAVLTWLMLETLRDGLTIRRTAIMGILAGWVALTKYSALAILPVLALAVVSSCILHGTALSTSLVAIASGAFLALTVSGWWFWRNAHEFNGDVLGTKTMYNTWATTFHRELQYYVSPWRIIKDVRWWRMMFFSFWGLFGYMNKYMWRPVYLAYIGFLITSSLGVAAIIVAYANNAVRNLLRRRHQLSGEPASVVFQQDDELTSTGPGCKLGMVSSAGDSTNLTARLQSRIDLLMWICLSLIALINLASMIWASTQNLGGPQGRYLFNSELPVMALMLAGLNKPAGVGDRLVIVFLVFNALVAVGSWIWLFQLYGGFRWSPL